MPFCDKCNEIYLSTHTCPPVWEGTNYESDLEDAWQYGIRVYAHTPEQAAERWCRKCDQLGDCDIISGGGADLVRVRKIGSEEEFRFRVVAEAEPTYSAHEI